MPDVKERRGRCLCGEVKIIAKNASDEVGACHCAMCRRWCGGPLMALDCGTEVSISGEESVSTYDSSDWAERSFCSKCGSHLFYRLKESGQHIVSAGLFDDPADFVFTSQVFIDEKPDFYSFANETRDMTGAEIFALYG